MSILETILGSQNGAAVQELSRNFGIGEEQAGSAVSQLLPVLMQGMKKNVSSPGGLESLLGALGSGSHQRYLDNPAEAVQASGVREGNGILGHLLGSKDVSRQVASAASERAGVDTGIMKQMLPMVATMLMGSLSKQSANSGLLGQLSGGGQPQASSGAMGLVSKFLDADGDGSMADDLLGMASKFLR